MTFERVVSRAPTCEIKELTEQELGSVSGGIHFTAAHVTDPGEATEHGDPAGADTSF